MFFILSKLLSALVRPSTLLAAAPAAGLVLTRTRWPGAGRVLLAGGIGGLAACLLLPVDVWAIRPLEDRFPVPALPDRVDGIIVLGGAIDVPVSAERGRPTLDAAGERLTAFATLARRFPGARLVFTGGSGAILPEGGSEAELTGELLAGLGLSRDRILFETRSRTTWENALFSARLAKPAPGETWVLVTSASQMPRAVGCFRRVGWPVLPWPVNYRSGTGAFADLAALGSRLTTLDWAAHEWVGLAAYRLLGRTGSLWPSPA